ncbi:MAG: helix-turn-helix domain-containing protein [Tissierellales bacterium]|jgi:putative transcriptional regulator|nr:helix-turn-helix domain-containing protein [Tissierellales bacterium]
MYEHLRELRCKKGFTLKQMSKLLGYSSPNAYARKEKGDRNFTIEEARKIAEFFEESIENIFFK